MNYSTLRAAVADFLNRDDLANTIPTFIDLAHARLQRDVRHWRGERRSNSDIDTRFTTLPTDYLEMTRLHIIGHNALQLVTQDQIQQWRDMIGTPRYYSVTGGQIEVAPVPAEAARAEMAYYTVLPNLELNGTNWLIEIAPDAYLYGTLLQTAPYLAEDQRVATWAALYESAVNGVNIDGRKGRWPGKLVMR